MVTLKLFAKFLFIVLLIVVLIIGCSGDTVKGNDTYSGVKVESYTLQVRGTTVTGFQDPITGAHCWMISLAVDCEFK